MSCYSIFHALRDGTKMINTVKDEKLLKLNSTFKIFLKLILSCCWPIISLLNELLKQFLQLKIQFDPLYSFLMILIKSLY